VINHTIVGIDLGKVITAYINFRNKPFFKTVLNCKDKSFDIVYFYNNLLEIKKLYIIPFLDELPSDSKFYIETIMPYSLSSKISIILEILLIEELKNRNYIIHLIHPAHIKTLKTQYPRNTFDFPIKNDHQHTAVVATLAKKYDIII
jgi:hypothetical protein